MQVSLHMLEKVRVVESENLFYRLEAMGYNKIAVLCYVSYSVHRVCALENSSIAFGHSPSL